MTWTALYFIHGQFMGEAQFASPFRPHSFTFVCPSCGELWARIVVQGPADPYWQVLPASCEQHVPEGVQEWGRVPGSILDRLGVHKSQLSVLAWPQALEHLPAAVLRREVELGCQWHNI